jgi:hypothetical protein
MRANVFLFVVFAFVVSPVLLLLPSCSSVPPTVTYGPSMAITGERVIAVTTRTQLNRIERSLRDAGFDTGGDWGGTSYGLEVRLGSARSSKDCGTMNNVVYTLRKGPQRVLEIKARGMTGSCSPNVFDDMSQTLARYFRHRD